MTGNDNTGPRPPGQGWCVLHRLLGGLSIAVLVAMTALTCIDVVARYWLNSPVDGAFELTQLFLATLIFAALPQTTAAGSHVDVELVTMAFGGRLERALLVLGQLISAVVLGAIGWRIWVHTGRLVADGTVTNSLGLSYGPIGYFAALSCVLSALMALARAVTLARRRSNGAGHA